MHIRSRSRWALPDVNAGKEPPPFDDEEAVSVGRTDTNYLGRTNHGSLRGPQRRSQREGDAGNKAALVAVNVERQTLAHLSALPKVARP